MPAIRLFFALAPSCAFLDGLEPVRRAVLASYAGLRLAPCENLHVTLKFLGQVAETRVGEIVAHLSPRVQACARSELTFDRLISLPSVHKAKVLALAADGTPVLASLVETLEGSMAELGFPREMRPFRAHLTLGRAKGRARLTGDQVPVPPRLTFEATEVVLFQSRPEPQGARYQARARLPLASS